MRVSPSADFTCGEVASTGPSLAITVDRRVGILIGEGAHSPKCTHRRGNNLYLGAMGISLLSRALSLFKGSHSLSKASSCTSGANQFGTERALGQLSGVREP